MDLPGDALALGRCRLSRETGLCGAQLDQRPPLLDHGLGCAPHRHDANRPRHADIEPRPDWCETEQAEPERTETLLPVAGVRDPHHQQG